MAADDEFRLEATPKSCWELWQRVRAKRPLVQCITNYVSMDIMANVCLAAGCSPAMAHGLDEAEHFASISSALLINMGTLSNDWVASKKLAAKQAVSIGVPWVLDPVGCGATPYRTNACAELLACRPTVVRGNASEIINLNGQSRGGGRGVDSTAASRDALQAAKELAVRAGCVVAVSGAVDYITDGRTTVAVHNGHEMLTLITAAGCALTALVAAFVCAAPKDQALLATAHALAVFGLAGEEGLKVAQRPAPGSLRTALIDMLHLMDEQQVIQGIKLEALQ